MLPVKFGDFCEVALAGEDLGSRGLFHCPRSSASSWSFGVTLLYKGLCMSFGVGFRVV